MNKKKFALKSANAASIAAGFLLPMIAAKAARFSAGGIYRITARTEPPRNPASPSVAWKEALVWATLAGVVGAVARLVVRRSLPHIGLPAEGFDMEDEVDEIDN